MHEDLKEAIEDTILTFINNDLTDFGWWDGIDPEEYGYDEEGCKDGEPDMMEQIRLLVHSMKVEITFKE